MVYKVKRVAAILLAICLMAGMMTFQAFAADNDNSVQIIETGGSNPTSGLNSDGVSVSKTIKPTDKENYFDITLEVITTKQVDEIYKEQDIAVVLVMDISNTMTEKFSNTDSTRYAAAVAAAETFIQTFAAHSTGTTANRKLGFVAFNTHGHKIFDMSNCTSTKQANNLIKEMKTDTGNIINQADYNASHDRFTNMEVGLKLAKDMLDAAKIDNQYIIFLSDGFPTTYVKSGYTGYDPYMDDTNPGYKDLKKSAGTDGYFYNEKTGKPVTYGTSYSDKAAERAQAMAAQIKKTATIFAIGVDVEGQSIANFENVDKTRADKSFSVIDCYKNGSYYIGGKQTSHFKNWLKNKIGSGHYYESTSVKDLQDVYNSIFAQIKAYTESEVMASWVIKDAMNDSVPEVIEFLNFYTKGGAVSNPTNKLTGKAEKNGENTASFANDSISWDLKNSGFTTSKNGSTTHYSYTLTYRVRLKNELSGFVPEQAYKTNGPTSLTYRVREDGELSDEKTVKFPIPEVEGYLDTLEFTKLNAKDNKGLADAQFTLKHNSDCPVCGGTVKISDMTATSDADGKVSIANIPSGHSYTLTESRTPNGFIKNEKTYAVVVSYGVVTLDGKEPSTIVNTPVTKKASLVLSALKYMDGETPETNEFAFQLKDAQGEVLQTVNNSGSNVEFAPIEYTEAGTYTYTISEAAGDNEDIIYDNTMFTVRVTVVEENYELKATVSTVGSDGIPVFRNETVPPPLPPLSPIETEVVLQATKLLDGETPATNEFVFQLKDAQGEVLQTVNNSGSNVEFAPIEYTEAGTYTYTISESAGDNETILYDTSVYTVTVVVAEAEGALYAEVSYSANDAIPVFRNETVPPPPPPPPTGTEVVLQATKLLDGETPATNEFTFQLKDAQGEVLQTVNNSGSHVEFAPIEYTEAGTYTYTISEVAGDNENIIYDTGVYTVIVDVVEENGALAASVRGAQIPTFYNETEEVPPPYIPEVHPAVVGFKAVKLLDGVAPENGQFKFELRTATGIVLATVRNRGEQIHFTPLSFTTPGIFTYMISEVIGTDDGIIYDDTVWTITVKITAVEMENGDIRLRASVTDLRANDETCSISTIPTFYNETKPPVDPEDPPVDPEDPPVDPEDPPVDPEDPPVDPKDPPVDPEDPPVDPEDPPVDPKDPPVNPEDPIDIPDEDVPRVDVPQTGDLSILWMAISGVAAAGLIGLGATRKKKDEA